MSTVNNCTKKDTCTSTDDKGESITAGSSVSREAILIMLEEHSRGLPANVEQLKASVEHITKNIKEFKDKEYINIFLGLKDLCGESNLPIYAAIMNRNIAMHHFYRNDINTAVELLHKTIMFLEKYKEINLIFSCYSDLGLIYYCDGECAKAREFLVKAGEFLPDTSDLDNETMFLYYYRLGLVYMSVLEYDLSLKTYSEAEKYADERSYKGKVVRNKGLVYKKDGDYKKALECYMKSLDMFEENDRIDRSVVYNNTAEIYKILGQYDKALEYINKAFEYVDRENMDYYFVYFETYTEIKILMREPEEIIDKFLDLLSNIKDFFVVRQFIITAINDIAIASSESMHMLERLERVVEGLISNIIPDDSGYKAELKKCIKKIRYYMNEINKGGTLI